MADVHERVHVFRQKMKAGEIADADPIAPTADALAEEAWLLCFDEFHVTDIADAMILGRLFTRLFEAGVVVVATSNVDPDELYKDGLNRALFLPFIALLREHMDVVRLEAPKDFRLEKLSSQPVWYVPADEDAEVALDNAWQRLTGMLSGEPCEIAAKGRVIRVPEPPRASRAFRSASLRAAARRERLSAHRARIPHAHPRRHSGDGLSAAQRGQALHRADRHALRQRREARGVGRSASRRRSILRPRATRRTNSSAPPRA